MENGKNIPMLHFTWSGEVKQENIYVEFNGERVGPIESANAVEIDCPINSDEIEININTGKKTLFKSKFKVEANKREFGIMNAMKQLNRQLEKVADSFGSIIDI